MKISRASALTAVLLLTWFGTIATQAQDVIADPPPAGPANAPEKPQDKSTPSKQGSRPPSKETPEAPKAKLTKDTKAYEETLNALAKKAEQVVKDIPEKPDKLANNLDAFREVLVTTRDNLGSIVKRQPELDAKADVILSKLAESRQSFIDLSKRIEDRIAAMRMEKTDNPQMNERLAGTLEGIKETCARGEKLIVPIKALVLETRQQSHALFSELSQYEPILDYSIETCDLYKKSIGDSVSYAAEIDNLIKARNHMRLIINKFIEATQKAEDQMKKVPQVTLAPIS
jgi:hypothetical protein